MAKCMLKPTLAAMVLSAAGTALAGPGAAPFDIRGSDTLKDVLVDAMTKYNNDCRNEVGFSAVQYLGSGSGNAEKAMASRASSYAYNWQLIGPMSRNLQPSALAACPSCAPELRNVLGLDAAVFVERTSYGVGGYSRCPNLNLDLAANQNVMQLILGGTNGTGTRADCRSKERLAAIETFRKCFQGVATLNHYYRRDDSSGTTDTFREKLKIQRFCNGTAAGTGGLNTANQDFDPIRADCPYADPTHAAVSCTFTDPLDPANFGKRCESLCDPVNGCPAGCTAGFVIALSQGDPGIPNNDVTVTIGQRVGNDDTVSSIGYAGREAVRLAGRPSSGPRVNNVGFTDPLIRSNTYELSRRLWLHDRIIQFDAATQTDLPLNGYAAATDPVSCTNANSTGSPTHTPDAGCAAGRDKAEGSMYGNALDGYATTGFFFWATDSGIPSLGCAGGKTGRQLMGPILRNRGFISCKEDDSDPTPGDSSNLCSLLDSADGKSYEPGVTAAAALIYPANWSSAASCSAAGICWSDGSSCAAGGSCPAIATCSGAACTGQQPQAAGFVCSYDADCTSGACDLLSRTCL